MKDLEKLIFSNIVFFYLTMFSIISTILLFVLIAMGFVNFEICIKDLRLMIAILILASITYVLYKRDAK